MGLRTLYNSMLPWFQDSVTVHTKIRPKDVPGTLLNVVCSVYVCVVFGGSGLE